MKEECGVIIEDGEDETATIELIMEPENNATCPTPVIVAVGGGGYGFNGAGGSGYVEVKTITDSGVEIQKTTLHTIYWAQF